MKTILITGASSGIGKASARLFSDRGWNVVATMRKPEDDVELRDLPNVTVLPLDVESDLSVSRAVGTALLHHDRIDAVVNNAGYGTFGTFEAADDDQVRRQFEVNVFGLMRVTRELLPHFRSNGAGTIINLSSVGGRTTFPLMSLYHATKFAVEGFSESLHYELEPLGIQVKLIEPGVVRTDFAGRSLDRLDDPTLSEYRPFVAEASRSFEAMERECSEPEQVAEIVFKAATDDAKRLRYPIGADAEKLLQERAATNDEQYFSNIRKELGV